MTTSEQHGTRTTTRNGSSPVNTSPAAADTAYSGDSGDVAAGRAVSGLLVLRGVLAVVLGIFALVWPAITTGAIVLLFGIYAIADGLGLIFGGMFGSVGRRLLSGGSRTMLVLTGVVSIAAGLIAIAWPGATLWVLGIVIGIWAIITGFTEMGAAVRGHGVLRHTWLVGLVGALSVIAGICILFAPLAGVVTLAIFLGAYALVAGVTLISGGMRVHRALR